MKKDQLKNVCCWWLPIPWVGLTFLLLHCAKSLPPIIVYVCSTTSSSTSWYSSLVSAFAQGHMTYSRLVDLAKITDEFVALAFLAILEIAGKLFHIYLVIDEDDNTKTEIALRKRNIVVIDVILTAIIYLIATSLDYVALLVLSYK